MTLAWLCVVTIAYEKDEEKKKMKMKKVYIVLPSPSSSSCASSVNSRASEKVECTYIEWCVCSMWWRARVCRSRV